jgi:hypothetical protein
LKVAVTEAFVVKVNVQVEVPVHAPDQPPKVDPADGVAVNVTAVPLVKDALQVAGQVIPAGLLVTVPAPVPVSVTVSVGDAGPVKVAVAEVFAEMLNVQVDVPLQAPDHPLNVDPDAGVAVSVTDVPVSKLALQVLPQLMPLGVLVTVPLPVPARLTLSTGAAVGKLNVAVTVAFADSVMTHELVPLHAPDQPTKVDPDAGDATSVTLVPELNVAEHVVPQLIPLGVLLTVPVPVPAAVTLN